MNLFTNKQPKIILSNINDNSHVKKTLKNINKQKNKLFEESNCNKCTKTFNDKFLLLELKLKKLIETKLNSNSNTLNNENIKILKKK